MKHPKTAKEVLKQIALGVDLRMPIRCPKNYGLENNKTLCSSDKCVGCWLSAIKDLK